MKPEKFQHAIECLCSADSVRYDEGYHTLKGEFLGQHLDAVIELWKREVDPVLRGRLAELLGDSGEARVIALLESDLGSEHFEVRWWTLHALWCFDTVEARAIVASHLIRHPEDTP